MNKYFSRFTPINDSDPTCDSTEVTLCIYNIDPSLVTHKLKIIPTYKQKQGDIRIIKGRGEVVNRVNSWLLLSKDYVSSKDIRTHLNWLLDKIEPKVEQIQELQQIPSSKMTIHCLWYSAEGGGGPTLWPEQMGRMANLNLECSFSFADYSENNNKDYDV